MSSWDFTPAERRQLHDAGFAELRCPPVATQVVLTREPVYDERSAGKLPFPKVRVATGERRATAHFAGVSVDLGGIPGPGVSIEPMLDVRFDVRDDRDHFVYDAWGDMLSQGMARPFAFPDGVDELHIPLSLATGVTWVRPGAYRLITVVGGREVHEQRVSARLRRR